MKRSKKAILITATTVIVVMAISVIGYATSKSDTKEKKLARVESKIQDENYTEAIESDLKEINDMINVDIEEAERLLVNFKEEYPEEVVDEIDDTIKSKLVINQKLKDIEALIDVYVDSADKLLLIFKEEYPEVDVSELEKAIDERRERIE